MSLRGLPDWHHPLGGGAGYAAYELPGTRYAPPIALVPAASGVHVDRYSQDRPGSAGVVHYGVHTLRWDTVTASEEAPEGDQRVAPLPLEGGSVRLRGPEVLHGPDSETPPFGEATSLDPAGLASFVATLTLDADSTDLVIDAYRRGTALITAAAVLLARGVAARHPSIVEVDMRELAPAVVHLADGSLDRVALTQLITDDPVIAGVRFTAGAPDDEPGRRDAVEAIVDRLTARFSRTLDVPSDVLDTRLRWDLSLALTVNRLFALESSPLAVTDEDVVVVRDHQPFALGTGWHRLSIGASIRAPWAGATIGYEAEVRPAPPLRVQPAEASAFFDTEPWATADLRLGVLEPVTGMIVGVVLFDRFGEIQRGTPRPLGMEAVVLPIDAFPARFVALDVGAGLEGYRLVAEVEGADGQVLSSACLGVDGAQGGVTLVAPQDPEAILVVRAIDEAGRIAASAPLAVTPLRIDVFLFPGTGSRELTMTCVFANTDPEGVAIELVPEGSESDVAATVRRAFTRSRPAAAWTRFVDSPFTTGFRWRPVGGAEWSEVVPGDSWTFAAADTKGAETR